MEWTEDKALAACRRNRINVTREGNVSTINLSGKTIGIKLWGAIDFLTNHMKYRNIDEERPEYRKHKP